LCGVEILEFFLTVDLEIFRGKRVLEVGSRYVNGSVKPIVELVKPSEYVGIDMLPGRNVDLVLPVEKLLSHFPPARFDIVISTETLEHIADWRSAIVSMKAVLSPLGEIFLTVPSRGFPYHEYPCDYWRFEVDDLRAIFRDFKILNSLAKIASYMEN